LSCLSVSVGVLGMTDPTGPPATPEGVAKDWAVIELTQRL
jgi:hypothetical protein